MGRLQIVMVLYGIFSIGMGLLGTIRSANHEIASLIGGGVAGVLVIGCAALTKTSPRVGFIAATLIGLAMAGKFAKGTFGGQVYPAGIIFVVSIAFAGFLVGAHFAAVSKRKREASSV